MKSVLNCLDLALVQSTHDAQRLRQLGAIPESIHVTGNMKFDQSPGEGYITQSDVSFRKILRIDDGEVLMVAGSTHPKEEEYLLDAYRQISLLYPHMVLVLAPRHTERASTLEDLIRNYGFSSNRRSRLGQESGEQSPHVGPRVILLDTRGELPFVYREGYITFVGGTLVPVGGHNLLEPAQWGKGVLFGPYVDHCRDIATLLLEAGGGIQIQNRDDLIYHIKRLMAHPSEAHGMGKKAFGVVESHRGVVSKNLHWIHRLLVKEDTTPLSFSATGPSSIQSQQAFR